ncbi:alpha-L-glutamate ligase-like protein [Aestuariicella hydrocarbonica]|uniref:Alpha-L-glutamate ligase-like protein n=1 Tax=Pseudomaricurvus hydrocarbonicus TaxID=1470433 RepID=A0A9E5ML52_9GAMM|nr:alpha-L-glutamate ligase-like protein [Aestuariicella hydrocarbonica]NHO66412.1 alpha-L-glutamate ligase-like protein [Aestuariicella hydrocarbonica]
MFLGSLLGLASPKALRESGIVGMNQRNVRYIARNNPRRLYPKVDNKYLTKLLCAEHGIAVPKLLGACRLQGHIKELKEFLSPLPCFVIKPAQGSGGKGILVIAGRDGEDYLKPNGKRVTHDELCRHVSNILSGLFSLGGKPDIALIEDMVKFTDDFQGFSFEGVPDIRVIVYKGFPVMAMTRLSTSDSDGKANLHQGAVGVGIDMLKGVALRGVQHGRPIEKHPDTGKLLSTLKVPHWRDLLMLAARGYEVSQMGYLGVDIVLDRHEGPLLLELNARPGLAIQVANGRGLRPRLDFIDKAPANLSYKDRVNFVLEHWDQ